MRVLVAGGTGALGRHLIALLQARGDEPVALARRPAADLSVVTANLRDYDSTRAAVESVKPDAAINLTGLARGDDFEIRATCVGGTVSLHAALAPGTLFVQVGSSAQYGCGPEPFAEDAPFSPLTAYGRAKAEAEAFALRQPNAVAVRPFNLIGPGQGPELVLGNAAAQIARAEQTAASHHGADAGPGGPQQIRLGDLSASRDLTDYRDAARAIALILDRGEPGTAYNVCTGAPVVIRDAVDTLVEMSPADLEVVEEGSPDPTSAFQVGDPSRINALGWQASIPLQQSLADLLEWARTSAAAGEPGPS